MQHRLLLAGLAAVAAVLVWRRPLERYLEYNDTLFDERPAQGVGNDDEYNDEYNDESTYRTCMKRAKTRCREKAAAAAVVTTAPPPATMAAADWQDATMTYYVGKEGASKGSGGKILTPFKSVAVKLADFKRLENKQLEIQGVGVVTVEDGCAGGACKDFDIYIGADVGNARQLPNWQAGNIPIKYRWL